MARVRHQQQADHYVSKDGVQPQCLGPSRNGARHFQYLLISAFVLFVATGCGQPVSGENPGGGNPQPSDVQAVAAGQSHSIVVDVAGRTHAWGLNTSGQLGDASSDSALSPVPVAHSSSVAFVHVTAGALHTVALDDAGQAWAWGSGGYGELGDGLQERSLVPVRVDMQSETEFTIIQAGKRHSLAVDQNGDAWAWGFGGYGQLGFGDERTGASTPVQVTMPPGGMFTAISGGDSHSLALDQNGNAWAWGSGGSGQLGTGDSGSQYNETVPVAVTMPINHSFTSIAAANYTSLAIDSNGRAWAWGAGNDGLLGNGVTDGALVPNEVTMSSGVDLVAISAGERHVVALDADGAAWAWGQGDLGQLGNGSTDDSLLPVRVAIPVGVSFTEVSAGGDHTLALGGDGEFWAWGAGSFGELGRGSVQNSSVPVQVNDW